LLVGRARNEEVRRSLAFYRSMREVKGQLLDDLRVVLEDMNIVDTSMWLCMR
jgi:hypothetical protein